MKEVRNVYKLLVRKLQGKIQLCRPSQRKKKKDNLEKSVLGKQGMTFRDGLNRLRTKINDWLL
jgi:hypothetical protein